MPVLPFTDVAGLPRSESPSLICCLRNPSIANEARPEPSYGVRW